MLSKISLRGMGAAARASCSSTAASASLRRGAATNAASGVRIAAPVPVQSVAVGVAARAVPSMSHAASGATPSSSLRLLLLLGSSLLVGGLALADSCGATGGQTLCDAAGPPVPLEASIGATARKDDAASIAARYNPPPPAYDRWDTNWDGLDGVPLSRDPKTGRPLLVTRHLLFIRHGQYVLPTEDTPADHDPVLTEKGHEQARLTGQRLRELGIEPAVIHVSTMARARQTAEGISAFFPGVPVRQSELLREGVPALHVPTHPTWRPEPEDIRDDPPRIAAAFEQLVQRWREYEGQQVRSQAEWNAIRVARMKADPDSLAQRKQRQADASVAVDAPAGQAKEASAAGALSSSSAGTIDVSSTSSSSSSTRDNLKPIHVDRYELIVCHGNVIRYSLLRALQLPVQAWLRLAVQNTGISHLIIRPTGNVSLYTLGDVGHLSKELITYH